jgi:hypothetical protein
MSSITAPTTLASFNIPADVPVTPVASSSKITLPVTLGPVFGGQDGECVAAVQGGALWIYDVRISGYLRRGSNSHLRWRIHPSAVVPSRHHLIYRPAFHSVQLFTAQLPGHSRSANIRCLRKYHQESRQTEAHSDWCRSGRGCRYNRAAESAVGLGWR